MDFYDSKFSRRVTATLFVTLLLCQFVQLRLLTHGESELLDYYANEKNSLNLNQRKLSQLNEDIQLNGDIQLKDQLLKTYFSTEQFEEWLFNFVDRCGEIARKFSIGKSVENRDLWVIEISDKPGVAEPEPNVKYVGNIHGNEPSARQILPKFAEYLCENYQIKGSNANKIVENMHLFFLPVMNPDGFENLERNNSNGIDLNRNFPDQYSHPDDFFSGKILDFEQPETEAVHRWSLGRHFVSSIAFHEGAFVVNYPYDGLPDLSGEEKYNKSPDDQTFQYISKQYAARNDLIMRDFEFPTGITNGAKWYPIYGGMQDWNYLVAKCFELTVEVYSPKTPEFHQAFLPVMLAYIWESNLEGMINFALNTAFGGVHGFVYDNSGKPLMDAVVQIQGVDWDLPVKSLFGDFWRPLAPGIHVVVVKKQGFKDFEDIVTVPTDGSGVFLEVYMERGDSFSPVME